MSSRHTTPPKVLPLLPICAVAVVFGTYLVEALSGVVTLIQGVDEDDDVTRWQVLYSIVAYLAVAVALGFALRWLIERWVERNPPRRGSRYDS
jgi:uncharacterized membrane protein HdeD (DUF308 family)